ncbi:MAG: hypothetical protein AB2814_04570 [Candidatus Sedimenticola endophacoides]
MISVQTLSEEIVGELRQKFDGIHFTYCSGVFRKICGSSSTPQEGIADEPD